MMKEGLLGLTQHITNLLYIYIYIDEYFMPILRTKLVL